MRKDIRRKDHKSYQAAKLALVDCLRRDTRRTLSARLVGAEIISRSWEDGGCSDAENWFVTVLGISLRTVKSAIAELRDCEYIRVVKSGRSNRYFPNLQKVQNLHLSGMDQQHEADAISSDLIGAESDRNRGNERQATGAKTTPLIPSVPFTQIPSANDGDGDGEARARAAPNCTPLETSLQIKAKSLAIQLAKIARLPPNREWTRHWQNATQVIVRWWDRGLTTEDILAGARLTMQQKPTSDPPLSIEYFTSEIEKVSELRKCTVPPAEAQRHLLAIAQKLGPRGWEIIISLEIAAADDLVFRWSKGEVSDCELHRLIADFHEKANVAKSA